MVFLQGPRQPPGVSNDLIIQKPAYLSLLTPKKMWLCFLLSLLCPNSLHASADYVFVNLSFYLPNRCMLWWKMPKHTLEAMIVISLAEADGLPRVPPWNQWNAREWLAGDPFHVVRSFGKRLLENDEKSLENGKCVAEAICYIPPCRAECLAWDERRSNRTATKGKEIEPEESRTETKDL